ncbi:MAG: tRNA pseudouridine(38-40) synthase TruA [Candidatus Binatia bacterium]
MHYRLFIEYDGTDFHGWQLQPGARTVQGELEAAVARLFGAPARVAAAGRTDAGVHACGQVATFRVDADVSPDVVSRALNALTAADLVVRAADVVADEFDPRRAARQRCYVYRIWNRREPSPFWRRYAWHVPYLLDLALMNRAAAELLGEHDFSSFRAAGCEAAGPVRRVLRSEVRQEGALLCYEIAATAFLRHMVRNIAGTLVEVGGARRDADLTPLLAARDRTQAGITAPAHGLCLQHVAY